MAAPKRPILWSPEAEADLTSIWSYYAEVAGPEIAGRMIQAIGETCVMLETHPLTGRARNEIRPGLRSVPAAPHVIFYRAHGDEVQIVRVLDGRRDIDEIFADDT